MLDVEAIRDILPHRYPFLLVDRILHVEPGQSAIGIKNVSINEEFFQGHFPGYSVMPGVLLIEAMAQVGGVMLLTIPGNKGKLAYFGGMDEVRFRKPVVPGDTVRIEATMIKARGHIGKIHAVAKVEDQVVAEGLLIFALVDRTKTPIEPAVGVG